MKREHKETCTVQQKLTLSRRVDPSKEEFCNVDFTVDDEGLEKGPISCEKASKVDIELHANAHETLLFRSITRC